MAHQDSELARLLDARGALVADGGMGTSLFALGLATGDSPELWNVEHPEGVATVHRGFVDVGSDVLLTNTFGGTRTRLDLHRLGSRVGELNAAAVEVARKVAAEADRPVLVAGSVGPTGSLFEPMGPLTLESAEALFAEQVVALAGAGADIIWIETLSSLDELAAAVAAAAPTGLPVVTTMSFDTHGRTMMGVTPADFAAWWEVADVTPGAIGANCGVGPADGVLAAAEIHEASPEVAVVVKANCGIPEIRDGQLWYPTSSDDMTDYARLALDGGARIVGACCGSVPGHLAQIREVVDSYTPADCIDRADVERRLGTVTRPAARERSRRRRSG